MYLRRWIAIRADGSAAAAVKLAARSGHGLAALHHGEVAERAILDHECGLRGVGTDDELDRGR